MRLTIYAEKFVVCCKCEKTFKCRQEFSSVVLKGDALSAVYHSLFLDSKVWLSNARKTCDGCRLDESEKFESVFGDH